MQQYRNLNKKGQEEIAAIFSFLVFAFVAITIYLFLGFASSEEKQVISGSFEDTNLKEALSVYLMTPKDSVSNTADVIINSINNKDFKEAEEVTFKIMEPGFLWVILIEGNNDEWIYTITSLEGYKKDRSEISEILASRGLLSFRSAEAYIPSLNKDMKNVKVSLIEIPERQWGEVPAMGV